MHFVGVHSTNRLMTTPAHEESEELDPEELDPKELEPLRAALDQFPHRSVGRSSCGSGSVVRSRHWPRSGERWAG
jgi:hypothetical protein